jgi:DNA repair exonuclease SbcCD nuclease subunit
VLIGLLKRLNLSGVDYIVFCGDLFDSRFAINVYTLNSAVKCIENLAYNFEKIFLIVGNHDTFYKNVNTVNSVKFLEKVSLTENVVIVEDDPYFIMIQDKILGLFPWGFNPNTDLEKYKSWEPCDYGFGHFETNGIELNCNISSGCPYNYTDLYKLADYVFCGHYHVNQLYGSGKKNNRLLMVGSPLQLDWGDYNRKKYIYTLDTETDDIVNFENETNSKFEKIFYSILENDGYSEQELIQLCKNNFIKFVIDVKYQFNNILKYTEILKEYKPVSLEIEYLISLTSDVIMESTEELLKTSTKDNKSYLLEYIQKMYNEVKEVDNSIDQKYLEELVQTYYTRSLLTEAEREEREFVAE